MAQQEDRMTSTLKKLDYKWAQPRVLTGISQSAIDSRLPTYVQSKSTQSYLCPPTTYEGDSNHQMRGTSHATPTSIVRDGA